MDDWLCVNLDCYIFYHSLSLNLYYLLRLYSRTGGHSVQRTEAATDTHTQEKAHTHFVIALPLNRHLRSGNVFCILIGVKLAAMHHE